MDTSALFKLSYGLYVTGVKTEKGLGGCIVDAVGQVAAGDNPLVTLACMKKNYTNECIKKTGEYTLSVLPANVDPFVIGNFGFQSGRNVEKWVNVPHTIKDGLPFLNNACAYLRFRVVNSLEFATHTMFISEVTDAENGGAGSGENPAKPLIYGDYQATMRAAVSEAFQKFKESGKPPQDRDADAAAGTKWFCPLCGYVYDGDIPFEQLPDTWKCPRCGVGKEAFTAV
ncbi:MAG: flavin reductase [Treponema sp.]|jgi:flavin reductase (DIM6/NTAB) family NADH-FMN oxidoreductase RutF/rubredoxin|nr:flavin reductase [Treponema sp.]